VLATPDANVARNAVSALRRAVPSVNPALLKVREAGERSARQLRIPQRKPWGKIADDIQYGLDRMEAQRDSSELLRGLPEGGEERGRELLKEAQVALLRAMRGVEGRDPSYVSEALARALQSVSEIEAAEAQGLPYLLPQRVRPLPYLAGRATAELAVAPKQGQGPFLTESGTTEVGKLTIVLDGYSAPVSAGSLAARFRDGDFVGTELMVSPYSANFAVKVERQKGDELPLELMAIGQYEPSYGQPLDIQNREYPVLPMSIYGAVCLSHAPASELEATSDNFFIYKFDDSMAGLGGLSFDEGAFSVVGYVTGGADLLDQLSSGASMVDARLVAGEDRLDNAPRPSPPPAATEPEAAEDFVGAPEERVMESAESPATEAAGGSAEVQIAAVN